MSEQQNYNRYEDEIDLRELFMVIWKSKITIIAVTLIFALLTGIVTRFFIAPVYEARLDLIVNIPETVNTKYGDYTMMMNTNEQYVNLIMTNDVINKTITELGLNISQNSIEKFSEKISITKDDKKPNSFTIKVKANDPNEALNIAAVLYENYIEFLNVYVKTRSIDYFVDKYSIELQKNEVALESNTKLLEEYKRLLKNTPQTINQKDALSIVNIDSVDYVVLENILNDNYSKIELDIINLEQQISNLNICIDTANKYLDELSLIKNDTEEHSRLSSEYFNVIKTSIYLPSQPVAPSHKVSPSITLNVLIGAVIGGMLSIIYVLIKKYWFSDVK